MKVAQAQGSEGLTEEQLKQEVRLSFNSMHSKLPGNQLGKPLFQFDD